MVNVSIYHVLNGQRLTQLNIILFINYTMFQNIFVHNILWDFLFMTYGKNNLEIPVAQRKLNHSKTHTLPRPHTHTHCISIMLFSFTALSQSEFKLDTLAPSKILSEIYKRRWYDNSLIYDLFPFLFCQP